MGESARQTAQGNNIAQAFGQEAIAAVIQQATIQQATLPESFLSLLSDVLTHRVLQPQFIDLFEIIRDPTAVPAAIFRIDPARGLAPYDVAYIRDREGVADIQSALYG